MGLHYHFFNELTKLFRKNLLPLGYTQDLKEKNRPRRLSLAQNSIRTRKTTVQIANRAMEQWIKQTLSTLVLYIALCPKIIIKHTEALDLY